MRFDVIARGAKGHSGIAGTGDLSEKLIAARMALNEIFAKHLTLKSEDGWQSQAKFPFINAAPRRIQHHRRGRNFGLEIRPIPQDDVVALNPRSKSIALKMDLKLKFSVMENGVACDPNNPALKALIEADQINVRAERRSEPEMKRKTEAWEEVTRHQRKIRSGRAGGRLGAIRHRSAFEERGTLHSEHRTVLQIAE